MKKNTTLANKIALALIALFATVTLSCCKDPEPKPQPPVNNEEDPQNPVNPDKPDEPKKGDFKEWLVLDGAGNLATVPIPFADYSKGIEDVKAWENSYGSTLYKEETNKGVTSLFYDTNDPKKLNEKRFYNIKEGKLQASIYSIASKLIFEPTFTKPIPNDAFEVVLSKEGYTRAKSQPKEGGVSYTNGKYIITYSYNTQNKGLTLAIVMPVADVVGDYKFHTDIKDLPLLLKGKYVKDYDEADIKAYEKKLGRLYSEKQSKAGEKLVFMADASIRTNFQKVSYDRKDGKNNDGTPRNAQIVANSLSIPNIQMLRTPAVEKYLKEQGFEYEKEISYSGGSFLLYDAKDLGFKVTIGNIDDKSTIWVFDKYAIKGGEDPKPQEGRPAYYLPLYMWDAPITENSPIIQAEKARGFVNVKFKPAEDDQVPPRPAEIVAEVPFEVDYASAAPKKLGMTSFSYTIDKNSTHPTKNVKVEMLVNYFMLNKEKQTQGKRDLATFLEGKGFQRESGTPAGEEMIFFNAQDKVQVQVATFMNAVIVTFTYREN